MPIDADIRFPDHARRRSDRSGFVDGPFKGKLVFELFGRELTYIGGPYRHKPANLKGVKMAKEIDLPTDWNVPTEDFGCPPRAALHDAIVKSIAHGITTGEPIYVGCMAGQGRTGLFMATVAYLLGHEEPVEFVRAEYYKHAVETEMQARFVTATYDRQMFRRSLMRYFIDHGLVSTSLFWSMPWYDKLFFLKMSIFG